MFCDAICNVIIGMFSLIALQLAEIFDSPKERYLILKSSPTAKAYVLQVSSEILFLCLS